MEGGGVSIGKMVDRSVDDLSWTGSGSLVEYYFYYAMGRPAVLVVLSVTNRWWADSNFEQDEAADYVMKFVGSQQDPVRLDPIRLGCTSFFFSRRNRSLR